MTYYSIQTCCSKQYLSAFYYLQCVVTSLLYHHFFDCHLPVPTLCNVQWHDGQGYTTASHTYLVQGSLVASTPGTRRLLQHFEQHVSEKICMILEHLQSIKSKTISTDGGLSLIGQATFGWMLTNAQGQRLVPDVGPVDGPATKASFTSSDLNGFAAPFEYIH
jgi:hypothetical protein